MTSLRTGGAALARTFRSAATLALMLIATAAHSAFVDYTPAPIWEPGLAAAARASVPKRATTLVLGLSQLVVPHGARVGTQVDRVVRDIHWTPSRFDAEHVAADHVPASAEEVVPYMEGARVLDLMRLAAVRVVPLGPGHARMVADDPTSPLPYGLAADGEGKYRFEVDGTKIEYETSLTLPDGIVEMPDTHGFNAVAEAALREKPFVAIACMDLPSKAAAALWLAEHGIAAYTSTDRFAYTLLGYRLLHPGVAAIVPDAPIHAASTPGDAVLGAQPVRIVLGETIVAQWTSTQRYPQQYADTPWRYFAALADLYALPLHLVKVQAEPGQIDRVLDRARELHAEVVAVRVGKSAGGEDVLDGAALATWLSESPRHRAVLFHSAAYEPGYALFARFPHQTTFGDLEPRFE